MEVGRVPRSEALYNSEAGLPDVGISTLPDNTAIIATTTSGTAARDPTYVTGALYAGNPPVRFAGRGGVSLPAPYRHRGRDNGNNLRCVENIDYALRSYPWMYGFVAK